MPNASFLSERAETRTNLFVLAAIRSSLAIGPVRIRNLSKRGMLVEGAILPPVGTEVQIERGSLLASGKIVWLGDGRAGIELASDIEVKSWLPKFSKAGQARVDELVHTIKAGLQQPVAVPEPLINQPDLLSLLKDLDHVSQMMAEDDYIVSRHGESIQRLDIIAQHLRSLTRTGPVRT